MADILDTREAGPVAIRGGVVRVLGYGAGVVLSVLSAALLFRHLGVEDSGRYVTVTSLVVVAAGLVDFGITAIAVRELAVADVDARGRLMRNLMGLRIVLSAIGVAGAAVFAAVAGYPSDMVFGTLLNGIGFALVATQSTILALLMVELRLGLVTLMELLRQVVLVIAIVALVAANADLLAFFAASIPAGLAVLVGTAAVVRGRLPLTPTFESARWAALLREILPFAAATALAAVYFRVSMVLLSLVSSAEQTGYFGASFRVVEALIAVPNLIVSGAFPIVARAARDDRVRLSYAVSRLFSATVVLGGWVALMLLLGAPFIMDVVAGPGFEPSADVLRIQAAALFVTFAGAPLTYALLSLRRHRDLLLITGAALAANAVLVPVLANAHGAEGAAAATVVAELILTGGAALLLARIDTALRPSPAVLLRAAPGFGLGCALLLVPGLPSVVSMVLGAVVYAVFALLLRAVPDELVIEARRAWRSRRRSSPPG